MPYIPPVTIKGLQDRIEKMIKTDKDFTSFIKTYTIIQVTPKLKAVWDAAITLAFYTMGGKDQTKTKGDTD